MKQLKIFLIFFSGIFFISNNVTGQANASINILTLNSGQVNQGSILDVQVTIGATTGTGGQSGPIPGNKVRVQISIPIAIAMAAPNIDQTGLPPGWIILSNSGSSITICNGTDIIPVGEQREILIKLQGTNVGGPSTIAGSLSFGPGTGVCTGPGSLAGDNTADNTATTAIQVLPPITCNLDVTVSAGAIVCNGGTTTLTATPSGNSTAVEYSNNGSAFQASNTFIVAAGTYTVIARLISTPACTATASPITITQPAGISATASSGTIACHGANTTLMVTANGGTAPLQYSLNGGAFQSDNTFTIAAGTNSVTVKDAGNCTVTTTPLTVTQPTAIVTSASAGTIACNGGNTVLTATANGGISPFQYSLNGGAFQSGNTFTVVAGTYTIMVKDANNCTVSAAPVTITEPAAIAATVSSGVIECNGGSTSLTITTSGGIAPYQYSINGGAFQSSNTFAVVADTYIVTIKDANNCTKTLPSLTIIQPALISASVTAGTINCFSGTTTLTVTASGGTMPYQYSRNGGAFQSGNTFTVVAGTHTVAVKDANNCIASINSITVTQPPQLTVTTSATPVTTPGGSDGTATAIANGGTPPYNYSWNSSPVQTTETATGLPAGTYTVIVTDSKGCTATATATINLPICSMTVNTSAGTIACNGGTTMLTATVSGGTGPYQYSLDGVSFQTINTFPVLEGTYTITVKDANNCIVSATPITITEPSVMTASASSGIITCNGGTTIITLTASGGTTPYQYSINGSSFQSANAFTSGAGTYTITVKDANNCMVSTLPITITEPAAITSSATAGAINCFEGTTTINVTASGGTAPFQYSLNSGSFQPGNSFTVNAAGSPYTVTVKDANNCTSTTAPLIITQPPQLIVSTTTTSVTIVNGTDGTATAVVGGGIPPYSYSWNSVPAQSTVTATGLAAGIYTVMITDSKGCISTSTATVNSPLCAIIASAAAGSIVCNGGTTLLTVTSSGALAPVQYSLNGGPYQSGNTFIVGAGTYVVTVKGANLCITSTTPVTVTQPAPIIVSASSSAVLSCNGGSATLIALTTGGTAPLQYSLNGGAFQSNNTFTITSGTYSIAINDANNCKSSSASVVITQPAVLKASATVKRITQCGGTSLVTITASGGTTPYLLPGGGTIVRGPGTWNFNITDANGCIDSIEITIEAPGCTDLKVFPNPAWNNININHSVAEQGSRMQVFDLKGVLIISQPVSQDAFITSVNINKLAAGIYIIVFWNGREKKQTLFEKMNTN